MSGRDSVFQVPLVQIDRGERLRPLDAEAVRRIAGSMADERNGQLVPIKVRAPEDGRFRVVAGAHRVAAALSLGRTEISCQLFSGTDEDAMLCEVDENLCRADLSVADQALFIQKKLDLFEVDGKKLRRGRDLRKSAKLAQKNPDEEARFYRLVEDDLGIPRRTAQRAISRARKIPAEIWPLLQGRDRNDGALLDRIVDASVKDGAAFLAAVALENGSVRKALKALSPALPSAVGAVLFKAFAAAWRDPALPGHSAARAAVDRWHNKQSQG